MVTRRSPFLTSAPSRKCTACTAPATRERTSTRSTASRRPENSSQIATSRCSTTATDTGTAWGAWFVGALTCASPDGAVRKTAAPAAIAAAATPVSRPRVFDACCAGELLGVLGFDGTAGGRESSHWLNGGEEFGNAISHDRDPAGPGAFGIVEGAGPSGRRRKDMLGNRDIGRA